MDPNLTISELAARTGFTASTLRYYEQVGLLAEPQRTPAGYRLYPETAVARLRFIDGAKRLGLRLEEIRGLVAVWDDGLCGHVQAELRQRIRDKQEQVHARIDELTAFAGQLETAAGALTTATPDARCGDGCGCVAPGPAPRSAVAPGPAPRSAVAPGVAPRPAVPQLVPLSPTRRVPAVAGGRA